MEARMLAYVLQTDTHKRLAAADEISEYLKRDETNLDEYAEMDRFVSALAAWMGSSNFKVSVSGMEIIGILVEKIGPKFKPHLPTIFPPLKERLGDAKEQVREQGQQLIQQIFQNVVGSPQTFLDKLMDVSLVHKNWRVKEQGLLCLSRTLSYFGSGQVTVSKYMGPICALLGDANSQVRSCAMETIVNIYRHVGVKVRIDVSRRNLQQSHLAKLNAQFDAVDATTGNSKSDNEDLVDDYDRESVSSSGSARTFGSTRSGRSSTAARVPSRPSSVARMATTTSGTTSGSGGVTETDFEKAFTEIPDISMFTQHDVEKRVTAINALLSDKNAHWEKRVAALKELRSVAKSDIIEPTHFIAVLRDVENSMELSLKDLRSQITREACITVSYLATILGSGFTHFAEVVIPQLIVLLPNSAKIMASSAEVCIKFIIKNTHSHRLLNHISHGMSSKSSVTRRQCAEFISLSTSAWSRGVLEKALSLLEELIRKGLKDADAQARKHMRRAFWGYHTHFPSNANRMIDTFDPQLVKYVNDERALLEKEANGMAATTTQSLRTLNVRKKHAPPLASQSETCLLATERSLSPPSPSKEPLAPAIRLVRPTIRKPKGNPSKILRPASSMETLLDRGTDRPKSPSTSPIPRPPSRTGKVSGIRPPSRSGIPSLNKRLSGNELLPGKKVKVRSRSAQPSPSHSRENSPVRDGVGTGLSATLPQRVTPLTAEAVKQLQSFKDGVGNHDDDAESVTSECSTFSISSEVSVSPYVRYPHPVTDLNELVTLCSSSQWSERRDGIGQLHMLLESSRPFTHSDMVKVKAVFKRMLAEPHAKVFSMFLDTLVKFIEEHREQLEDWLFIMLLRLLHRQGTDMLSSVHFKLQIVLENIRKSFDEGTQFSVLCRILTDQTQPMNNKVKLGWLEYFLELLPSIDSASFKDSTEIRQALTKLLAMTMEPKSADIRRLSQKVIIGFFDLNPATLTLLLRNMSKALQESANRILKGYMNDMSSSSGEESDKEATPKRVRRRTGPATSTGGRTTPSGLRTPQYRPKTPQSSKSRVNPTTSLAPTASLPPSGPRGLRGARNISSSSPAVNNMDAFLNRSSSKSQIPTPRSVSRIPRRPGSTTPGATPSSPATVKRAAHPPRAQSVDPYKMASQSLSSSSTSLLRSYNSAASKIKRPSSSRSEYTPMRYQNGSDEGSVGTPGSLEQFSFSDLPHLDFGSPDEDEGDRDPTSPGDKDQMATLTRELQTASSTKNRQAVLHSLMTLSREYPEKCNWEEYFKPVLLRLLDLMGDSDTTVKLYSLRVLREMLKTQHERLKDYSELTTLKVLKCFTDSDSTVSQASEDVFILLAPALPSQSAVDLLSPMVATEKHPMLLGTIKLFTKVISLADADYVRSKLGSIVPGIIRGYCHSESSVRKGSVFCLVALHSVVGDDIREHLTKLSSSQTKLLDLYIKRHQQEAASKAKT